MTGEYGRIDIFHILLDLSLNPSLSFEASTGPVDTSAHADTTLMEM
jgi:hypothetical protein